MSETENKIAKPIEIVTDMYVRCDFPEANRWTRFVLQGKSEEEIQKAELRNLEDAVKDFKEFLRDHRSQDVVDMEVVQVKEKVCSVCQRPWEVFEDDDESWCACCGAKVEQQV